MNKKKKCLQCKKEFEDNNSQGRFVRKYCKDCGEKRKKRWDDQWKIKFEDLDDE